MEEYAKLKVYFHTKDGRREECPEVSNKMMYWSWQFIIDNVDMVKNNFPCNGNDIFADLYDGNYFRSICILTAFGCNSDTGIPRNL